MKRLPVYTMDQRRRTLREIQGTHKNSTYCPPAALRMRYDKSDTSINSAHGEMTADDEVNPFVRTLDARIGLVPPTP